MNDIDQPNVQDFPKPIDDYSQVSLRFRDLRGRDLANMKGLTAWALAGSDLRGARLPEALTFDLVERAVTASKQAQNIFLTLLTSVVVCWLIRIGTNDFEIASGGASVNLPFLSHSVNPFFFYLLSPLLILAVYAYFHLALQQVLEAAVNLPKYFPDGLRIDKKLPPWPLLRFSELLLFPQRWQKARLASKLKVYLTVFFMWVAVPAS